MTFASGEYLGLNPLGGMCECVAAHSPATFIPAKHHILPQSWGGLTIEANLVWLCPNAHTATHRLIDTYVRVNGDPGWVERRRYSSFVRDLAARAWAQRPAVPTITSTHH